MTPAEIQSALHDPFDPSSVGWKPQAAKGNRALAVAYIDARDVMDRLDDVVGVGAWQDEYQVLPDGSVLCHLRVRLDGEWVTKSDVGGMSEQPDAGDRLKAAFSDALKRAAVKFGIGRYLYSLPSVWCDYDPQKKQFSATPQLPAWAVPAGAKQPKAAARPAAKQAGGADGPATLKALHDGLAKKVPPEAASDLAGRVVWIDQQLGRLMGKAHNVGELAASVCDFAKVKDLQALGELPHQKDVAAAWNNALQFVKGSLDVQGKQPATGR